MAESRVPRIADRENDYQMKRRQMIISPERHDPFAGMSFALAITVEDRVMIGRN